MMKTGNTYIISTMVSALLLLPACGSQKPAVPKNPEAAKPQPVATALQVPAPQVEIKAEKEVYVYDAKGRRDPFTSLVEVKSTTKKQKGASPIESFDLEEITLIAIAWDRKQSYAMVTLPDKKSFTIRKGMAIGLYGGKVTEINRDSVIITEQVKNYKGQLKTKDTILKLRKEEE